MTFFLLIFISGFYAKIVAVVVCVLAIFRNKGFPKFNKYYAASIISTEFFSNLFYILAISLPPAKNGLLFMFPLGI
jgi:hypothetical protein